MLCDYEYVIFYKIPLRRRERMVYCPKIILILYQYIYCNNATPHVALLSFGLRCSVGSFVVEN